MGTRATVGHKPKAMRSYNSFFPFRSKNTRNEPRKRWVAQITHEKVIIGRYWEAQSEVLCVCFREKISWRMCSQGLFVNSTSCCRYSLILKSFGLIAWKSVICPEICEIRSSAHSRQLQCEVPCRPVMSSILPCPPCLLHRAGSRGGRVVQQGGGRGSSGGRGQGTFHPPCHILHYHMVLRPKGTSHNKQSLFFFGFLVSRSAMIAIRVDLSLLLLSPPVEDAAWPLPTNTTSTPSWSPQSRCCEKIWDAAWLLTQHPLNLVTSE